jgi:hypothetical protein
MLLPPEQQSNKEATRGVGGINQIDMGGMGRDQVHL